MRKGRSDDSLVQSVGSYSTDSVRFFENQSVGSTPIIELLTIPEAANFLRISQVGVRRLQQKRRIPFVKVGGSIRFVKSDLVSFIQANRVETIGQ